MSSSSSDASSASADSDLAPTGQPISFFQILKSLASQMSLGTDITRITLPSIFAYPLSLLEIMAKKRMRGMDQLRAINETEDQLQRTLLIMKWFYSSLTPDEFAKKPLNPILGETFECRHGSVFYLAEQVSHHPPITAYHFEDTETGITYYGHLQVVAKFGGNSVGAEFLGEAFLHIPSKNELYQFSYPMPVLHARGLMIGKSRNELGGEMWMTCTGHDYRSEFSFKTTGMFSGTEGEVSGRVHLKSDKKQKPIVTWDGIWSDEIYLTVKGSDVKLQAPLDKKPFFRHSDVSNVMLEHYARDGAVDSRSVWGATMEAIRAGNLSKADEEKGKVETAQRERRAQLESDDHVHEPVHFVKNEADVWVIKPESRPSIYYEQQRSAAAAAASSSADDQSS